MKIDTCKNDCILYRKEFGNFQSCPTCGCFRWENVKGGNGDGDGDDLGQGKKIPQKVLHHFPLIPKLKRFYLSSKLVYHM